MAEGYNNQNEQKNDFLGDFLANQSNKKYLDGYSKDTSLSIKHAKDAGFDSNGELVVKTAAIDLENGKIFFNPDFFARYGKDVLKQQFALKHECWHFKKLKQLLDSKNGKQIWQNNRDNIKNNKKLHLLDNCFEDIQINRGVISDTPTLQNTKDKLYKEDLFQDVDFTKIPKHLQFAQGLLVEKNSNYETICKVDKDVRKELDKIKSLKTKSGFEMMDFITNENTSMGNRVLFREKYLDSVYQNLYKQDIENKKKEKDSNSQDSSSGQGNDSEPSDGQNNQESENQDQNNKEHQKNKKTQDNKNQNSTNPDYDANIEREIEQEFQKYYDEYFDKNPRSVEIESEEKAVEEYFDKLDKQDSNEARLKAYAQAEGISYEDLKEYRDYFNNQVENLENKETGEKSIEELRQIFEEIFTSREKPKMQPRSPRKYGDELILPAEAYAQKLGGEEEPSVFEKVEFKNKKEKIYGDFDVTLVLDRSGSMDTPSIKKTEQKKSAILIIEALKELYDKLDEGRDYIENDLNVRTEVWSFGDERQNELLKPLDGDLTEKQRTHIYKKLNDVSGNSTEDYKILEKIESLITDEELEKLEKNLMKKIIIVTTDGQSDGKDKLLPNVLQKLRAKNIVVIGIGITKDGKKAEKSYAPNGIYCKNATDLPNVFGEILKKELDDLIIR